MPVTFFAHQAPVLPLKILRPAWFSGQALIWGSMAPDFEFFPKGQAQWGVGHTVIGQFTFCLPATLLMVWVVSRLVARPLALHLPDFGSFHLHDYRVLADTPRQPGYWRKVIPSALIGSFSHILWDSFTHSGAWTAEKLGYSQTILFHIGAHAVPVCHALQYLSTVVGASVTLFLMEYMGRNRLLLRWAGEEPSAPDYTPSTASYLLFWLPALLVPLIGGATLFALMRAANPGPDLHFWSSLLLRITLLFFLGLCLGGALCSRRMNAKAV